jgi:hypothetical protein
MSGSDQKFKSSKVKSQKSKRDARKRGGANRSKKGSTFDEGNKRSNVETQRTAGKRGWTMYSAD